MVGEEISYWFFCENLDCLIISQTKTVNPVLQFLFEIKFISKKNKLCEKSPFFFFQKVVLLAYSFSDY